MNVNSELKIDEEIQSAIKRQSGWMQIVNSKDGTVIASFNTPEKIPSQYSLTSLSSIMNNTEKTTFKYITWKVHSHYLAILGQPSLSKELLNSILDTVNIESIQPRLDSSHSWYVVYDANGQINQQYNFKLSQSEMLSSIKSNAYEPEELKFDIASHTLPDNSTIIVGTPNDTYGQGIHLDNKLGKFVVRDILVLFLIILISLFVISAYYAQKWGKPLLSILQWIQNLAAGKFDENKEVNSISSRKKKKNKSELLFSELTNSLEKLSKELSNTENYRKELETMREEWISGLSHDLKTPLSSILGYSILLKDNKYSWSIEETQKFGKTITEKAKYIQSLIDDLNLTYDLKNHALPLEKTKTNMDKFVKEIVIDFLNQPINENVDISYLNQTAEEVFLPIDQKQFKRILNNLLANAVKYSKIDQPNNILVILKKTNGHAFIIVKDEGIGMDEKTLKNLFNRYYRGTSSTEIVEGSGLGLAITKQLVEAHKGEIEVQSTLHKGTTISLHFKRYL
ncbi:HAMP domain-containing histidine kinase [Metabacillus idriensis]|uniref:sensor histidine kinase n=1 Tax=Metabacillus idriensis TaxID=324768 RepID=UPI00203F87DC|nr:HAMP domain-containing sensor histidine kinase [Metabacillus idriensis]MCM3597482.1 HAMP domain-containing histidine kinase [Metabacillus idriensis]